MHPPSWVCEALYRINNQLRIGWEGREKQHEDDLNPGAFAIIQLYHISDVGGMDDLKTFRGFWDREIIPNERKIVHFERLWRGPLYDRHGGTSVDYDKESRIPVFVCTLDEHYCHMDGRRMKIEHVFDGSFLDTIRYWQVPVKRRIEEKYREMGKKMADDVMGVGEEMGKFLYRESQRTGHTNQRIAKKFTKGAMQAVEEKHEKSRQQIQNYYLEHI